MNCSTTRSSFPVFSDTALGFWRLHTWGLSSSQLSGLISFCTELGITTFDHADIYGSYSCEEIFGNAMAGHSSLRSKIVLVSKCGIRLPSERRPEHGMKIYDTGYAHIVRSVDNSLKALQTDYLDVLLIHRPNVLMDAGEVAEAFHRLSQDGKVLFFGVSNFSVSQFDLLQSRLGFPLITNQVEISVMKTESFYNGVLDQCQQRNIRPMAWSPLSRGELFHSQEPQAQRLRNTLQHIADSLGGFSIDQVALAWLFSHPSRIVPIIGTGNPDRIKKAVVAQQIMLQPEQWFSILNASHGFEIP